MAIVLGGVFALGFSINDAIKMNSEGYSVTVEGGKVILKNESNE